MLLELAVVRVRFVQLADISAMVLNVLPATITQVDVSVAIVLAVRNNA